MKLTSARNRGIGGRRKPIGPPNPRIVSADIASDGTTLILLFDRKLIDPPAGAGGFTLTGLSGGATTLSLASAQGATQNYTINRTVAGAETGGAVGYTNGVVTSQVGGGPLLRFSGFTVSNNSMQ